MKNVCERGFLQVMDVKCDEAADLDPASSARG